MSPGKDEDVEKDEDEDEDEDEDRTTNYEPVIREKECGIFEIKRSAVQLETKLAYKVHLRAWNALRLDAR
ncbi:hypothetical protein HZH66_014109 [Vespula vulgaris]|uniref:Uncharacterized protein n=1 Tax=Vespula vulgaris TaxID=7454 RepID=A0A834MRY3_VESVU|nr:hypothetical protein HZH66_014109 [Vespula vulgaris]